MAYHMCSARGIAGVVGKLPSTGMLVEATWDSTATRRYAIAWLPSASVLDDAAVPHVDHMRSSWTADTKSTDEDIDDFRTCFSATYMLLCVTLEALATGCQVPGNTDSVPMAS